jgi:hypothetical protein
VAQKRLFRPPSVQQQQQQPRRRHNARVVTMLSSEAIGDLETILME